MSPCFRFRTIMRRVSSLSPSLIPGSSPPWRNFSHQSSFTESMILLPSTVNDESQLPWKLSITQLDSLRLRSVSSRSKRRPEHSMHENFYSKHEVKQYLSNQKNIRIQTEMTCVAVRLLKEYISSPSYLLDLGCGACLSGEVLESNGLYWSGLDLSNEMLKRRKNRGLGVLRADMFQSLPFRDSSFHGILSLSTLQWAFADFESRNLSKFFVELNRILVPEGCAVIQFYPANYDQVLDVFTACDRYFVGALIVAYPHHNSAKKLFLCLINN